MLQITMQNHSMEAKGPAGQMLQITMQNQLNGLPSRLTDSPLSQSRPSTPLADGALGQSTSRAALSDSALFVSMTPAPLEAPASLG